MASRTRILSALRTNKPGEVVLPAVSSLERPSVPDLAGSFRDILESIGGTLVPIHSTEEVSGTIARLFPEAKHTASTLQSYKGTVDMESIEDPKSLEMLDVFVCEALLGVAENGAVWVPENRIGHRVAPFITQHLVVLLNKQTLVADMHAAYDEVEVSESGFGVFIAGPSKTADIEQSLVLGAHGPRSMTVLLQEK